MTRAALLHELHRLLRTYSLIVREPTSDGADGRRQVAKIGQKEFEGGV